jgi:hypothetical protein
MANPVDSNNFFLVIDGGLGGLGDGGLGDGIRGRCQKLQY